MMEPSLSGSNADLLERTGWKNQMEFFFSCVGYAVGLGNIWRFPYLAFQYGGGAFLIPYTISLALCGLPLFFMELAFGQFASVGPITIWRVCPLFQGIGIAMVLITFMVCLYYNVIILYGMYYCVVSLVSLDTVLPWSTCDNSWNTKYCVTEKLNIVNMSEQQAVNSTLDHMDFQCVNRILSRDNVTMTSLTYNYTQTMLKSCDMTVLPSEEYFTRHILRLNEADDIGHLGGISLKLLVFLALAWLILFFILRKGVETSGKVAYFMALFPYFVLVALLIRSVTLPGYLDGIKYYIIPEWEKIANVDVWREAATQIFYSLGLAFGTLITLASYNPFKHNCYRDAILVAVINCSTSVFAGFVIFSMLGYMAHVTNQDVQSVTTSGPGLVFVVYPEGISRMPFSVVWSILFFVMLISLGLDSQFAMFETVISAVVDEFPRTLRKRRVLFSFICHVVGFLLGIPLTTYGGIWVLTLMNTYSGSYSLMFTCLCELVALNYVYGNAKFCTDIEMMIGFRPNLYWRACWMVITPVTIVIVLALSCILYTPVGYGDYQFEPWAQWLGFTMVSLPVAAILFVALFQCIRYKGIKEAMKPNLMWGPAQKEYRIGSYGHLNEGLVMESPTFDLAVEKETKVIGAIVSKL
nr:sodium- and chloride-dependent glycine transporter 2-like; partial [Biomphalaria glabrata]